MLLRKVNSYAATVAPPYAGITLTRFYGYDLRSRQRVGNTPETLKTKPLDQRLRAYPSESGTCGKYSD